MGVHCDLLGKRALSAQQALVGAPEAITHGNPANALTDRLDRSRRVTADDERIGQIKCDGPTANVGIDRIDRAA